MKIQQLFTPLNCLQEDEAIAFMATLQKQRAFIEPVRVKIAKATKTKIKKDCVSVTPEQLKLLRQMGLL